MQTTATAYLSQISSTLAYIRDYYLDLMEENDKITFAKFDRVYNYIDQSYKNGFIGDQQLFSVHGYFHQTIKKFKRVIENRIHLHSTDYDACFQKLQRQKVKLIPVFTELIFDQEKQQRLDLQSLTDFNMQHHIYTKKELCQFSLQIFDLLQLDSIKVPQQQLNSLIHEICINYNVVAYHNFTHAFQLSQLLFSCYIKSKLKEYCTQLEIFSAIIAGLSHDLNHKGVNNGYKVKKSKKYNIITSETAVLENMHCATFFNLLQLNRDLDIFQHLANDEEKNNAKRLIITCILATDMGKHFKLLTKFQKRVQATIDFKNENTNELIEFQRLSKDKPEDRVFLLNIMTHACDISNPTMNFDTYMNWSYLLAQEFQDQTLKEAGQGVEVTGFLQYKDKMGFYGGQIGFSKNLVLPLWTPIGLLFPELKELSDNLNKNLEILAQKLKQ